MEDSDSPERYHREVDDPRDWDEDDYAITGPVEAHGRGVDFGLLVLRAGSLTLLPRGLHKAFDMPGFTAEVASKYVGSQAPDVIAWLVMLAQVGLPVLVLIGLFTRPAAFLIAALMATPWGLSVALRMGYTALGPEGQLTGESAILFVFLALPLVFTGAGRFSVDNLRTAGRP